MKRLGTFSGVFVPSFEAILGAVLFLILPLLVGAVGLPNMLLIVVLANTATVATAFSIADCTTNLQDVGPGGMYAVSKRSLGLAFGGSIGIQLFLAQAVSIGFYAAGFAEPLQRFLVEIPAISEFVEDHAMPVLRQKQIIATGIGLIAFVLAIAGADFIVKIQSIIFVVLSVSVLTILISPFFRPLTDGQPIFSSTFNIAGTGLAIGFWGAFATFFPAVTGIDAGVGMSGSLKDPKESLSKGTFLAIAVTFVVYMVVTIVFSRVRPGILTPDGAETPSTLDIFAPVPIIYAILLAGILFATGSSALSYFLTAPRTAQALAQDGVLPKALGFLARDFRKGGSEPRFATILTLLLFLPVIWAGDIAFASLIVGICFLTVYGWVNLAAFFERISGNPSFRPTSKGHWLINLYGFLICMAVIALFNFWVGIGVLVSQIIIFWLLLKYRSKSRLEGVWWGVLFTVTNWALKRLGWIVQGTKNWRPIVGMFVMADREEARFTALEMGRRIADYKGLIMVNVLTPSNIPSASVALDEGARTVSTDEFDRSILAMSQAALPGDFEMNTIFLPLDTRLDLLSTVQTLIDRGKNVLLYKHGEATPDGRIDVWWKGQENGNLMALLSYMISQSDRTAGNAPKNLRFLRKLFPGQEAGEARAQLLELMAGARLRGEVIVLEADDEPFDKTVREQSEGASLVMLGMPGEPAKGIRRVFALDRISFTRSLEKYDGLPPILFVKAAGVVNLLE